MNQMYYYAVVPNGCGQGQVGQPFQGGDGSMGQGGMPQGNFDPNQQMQNFTMGGGGQGYGGGGEAAGWQHDQMQQMQQMGGQMQGNMPGQQMVLMMMPNQGQQQGGGMTMMDQSGGCGAGCTGVPGQVAMGGTGPNQWGPGCCGGCGAPQVNNPQQQPVPPNPPQQGTGPAVSATQETPKTTKAFPIVDPKTSQDITDTAPANKKKIGGLKNMKLTKKTGDAPAATAAAGTESALAEVPKASAPEPARPSPSSEATVAAASPSSSATTAPSASTEPQKHSPLPQIPAHPKFGAVGPKSGQGQNFASSIKALNLEPMRSNPARAATSKPSAPALLRSMDAPAAAATQDPTASQELALPAPAPGTSSEPVQPLRQQAQQPPQQPQQPPPQQMQQMQQPQQMQEMQQMQQMQQQQQMMMQMQMQMQHQQMQPQALPTSAAQPVQPPAPAAPAASSSKPKGFKLQNVSLKKAKAGDAADGEPGERKEAPKPIEAIEIAAPQAIASSSQEDSSSSAAVAALRPKDGIFQRELLLRIWRMNRQELHSSVSSLTVGIRPPDQLGKGSGTPDIRGRHPGRHKDHGGPTDRHNVFGTDMRGGKTVAKVKEPALKPSLNGYKVVEASSRSEDIERRVRSLLNKICPDNLGIIVEQLAHIELFNHEELEFVIRIIFSKALAEPHYCETYADMVYSLRVRYPEFPPQNPDEKPHTFVRVLLNTCQNEFESLPTTFSPTEEEKKTYGADELNLMMKQRKDKMLANMKFIGHLFLRQLLAVKVIGQVVHDLIGIKEAGEVPEEHMIECVCELLQAIGYTLDETPHGKNLMDSFAARLRDLARHTGSGSKTFSKRVQFQIEDLLDLRKNQWAKKLFKEQAKSKEEIRKDAIRDAGKAARGAGSDALFSTKVVGQRPSYIDEQKKLGRPKPVEQPSQKVVFDQNYVKKCFQYYAEDKNGDSLQNDWQKAQPNNKEAKQGMEWLFEIGFNDPQKADVVAETVSELMGRKLVQWDILREAFAVYTAQLEDSLIDMPQCDRFVHYLLSRLISLGNFAPAMLKSLDPLLSSDSQKALSWKCLLGTLRKLKERGQDAMRKALSMTEFVAAAASARGCSAADAKRQLEQEI